MVIFRNFWIEQKETCIGPIRCLFVLFVNLILNNNKFEKAVVVYCGKIVLWRYRIRQSNLSPQLIHAMWKWFIIFSLLFTLLKFFFWNCHQIHSNRNSFTVYDSEIIHSLDRFNHHRHFMYPFQFNKTNSLELHLINNNYRLFIS